MRPFGRFARFGDSLMDYNIKNARINLAIRVQNCIGIVTLMRRPSIFNYLIPIVMSIVPLRFLYPK
ncbi:hypothetical protein HanIR_Chr01g0021861 [Helianthus annuus]|nr:hypothetical protein HanIR_Chr01g0021861 [Helianthus annuus]